MTTAKHYRQFAQECIESAREATSESIRKQFLDLAKLWMTAADQIDARDDVPSRRSIASKADGSRPPGSAAE